MESYLFGVATQRAADVLPGPRCENRVGLDAETAHPALTKWFGFETALLGRANFAGLAIGCIKAKFCKKICV